VEVAAVSAPFVGREPELAALYADLDASAAGRGGVVLLAGEAGIGKTRLAEELSAQATVRSVLVLWGRCWEGEGAAAFWPWVQLIRAYVKAADAAALRHDLGSGAADIAQLVPAVRDRLPDLPDPLPIEPEAARFRLFDSVTGFLRAAAARQPLLLILDDLHWADAASLALLRFAGRELEDAGVMVVGIYRHDEVGGGHPLLAVLADLTHGKRRRRLVLDGLDQHEVAGFVALVTGVEPSPGLVVAVHRWTDGNPFFVTEVVRLLASQGRLEAGQTGAPHAAGLPEGVKAVVAERLARLSGGCRQALEVAAVVGRDFELRVLRSATGLGGERLLRLLADAEPARVVAAVPGGLGRWRFAHALVREVVYEGLPAARRVRLHGRVGEALEEVHGADPGPHLSELAHHFVAAAPGGQVARAVLAATLAGRRALEVLAWEEAARQFESALSALELAERPDQQQRCELLLAVAEARLAASDVRGARTAYQQAGELARRIGAPEELAKAGLGLGMEFTSGIVDEVEVGLLEEALLALGRADTSLRARVLARLAKALLFTPQAERRLELSNEAVHLARRLGDPATLAAVLYDQHLAVWGPDPAEGAHERLAVATEVVSLAEQLGDRAMALRGLGLRRGDLLALGDGASFDADLTAAEQTARELRQLHHNWQLPLSRATRALLAGRFAEAEEQAAQGLSIGRRAGDQAVTPYYIAVITGLRFVQGRYGETVETLLDAATRFPGLPFRTALAAALADAGQASQAQAEVDMLTAGDLAAVARYSGWSLSLAMLAYACHRLGDTKHADQLYGLLEPYADRNISIARAGAICVGPASYFLGLLDLTLDRPERAVRRFEHAITLADCLQARPIIGRSLEGQASALLALGRPGDREQAAALLEQVVAIAGALGICGLGERASSLLEELAAPVPAWPAGLTGREVEVLRLIAAGSSNRAIAQALFISPNTVLRHVSNIFTKTGVANRAEAAAYATRQGLAE